MKFKVGDRVRIIDTYDTQTEVGDVGIIKVIDKAVYNRPYGVELERKSFWFHNCDGQGSVKSKHGQWVSDNNIELINPSHEFKLIVISKGDTTTAKLIHGERTVVKEATVTRYSTDEYSEKAAVEAVVKKIFDKGKEKDDLFNGKAMATVYMDTPRLIRGYIYTFKDGIYTDDTGRKNSIPYTNREMENHIWFIPIAE